MANMEMVMPTSPSPSSPSSSGSADDLASLLEAELEDVRVEEGDDAEQVDDAEEADYAEAEDDATRDEEPGYEGTDAADLIEDEAMRDEPIAVGDDSAGDAGTGTDELRKVLDEDGGGKRRRMCGAATNGEETTAALVAGGKAGQPAERGTGARASTDGRSSGGRGAKDRSGGGCPPHPGFMWGVCIRCGVLKERAEAAGEAGEAADEAGAVSARARGGGGTAAVEKEVALRYIHHAFELSAGEAARMVGQERARMVRRRRLYLVLDLDHTLLNSARDIDVPPQHEAYLAAAYTVGGVPLPRPAPPPAASPPAASPPASLATAAPAAASPPAPSAASDADAAAAAGRPSEAACAEAAAPCAAAEQAGQAAGSMEGDRDGDSAVEPPSTEAGEAATKDSSTATATATAAATTATATAPAASPAATAPTPAASPPPPITLFRLPHIRMWTKLRPGISSFLHRAHDLFDLIVYTNGERAYAHAMAALLDPTGRLFGGRVISHGDSTVRGMKDLDVVLGEESMVLILDDSEVVWPKHRQNLLLVERYHFFASSRQHFLLPGPSLLESHVDEADAGGLLDALWTPLSRTHQRFFRQVDQGRPSPDVRQILAQERQSILASCHLVFSRVFPTDASRPQTHPLWRMAESMGATCHTQIGPQITHVVALDCGTDKAIWAVAQKRHLVHPGWLEASLLGWKRADEKKFPVDWGKGRAGWCPSAQVVATVAMPAKEAPPLAAAAAPAAAAVDAAAAAVVDAAAANAADAVGAAAKGEGVAVAGKDTEGKGTVEHDSAGAGAGKGGTGEKTDTNRSTAVTIALAEKQS